MFFGVIIRLVSIFGNFSINGKFKGVEVLKLKEGFITYVTDGQQIMVAAGSSAELFHGLVCSNETAAFIVDALKTETTVDEIVDSLAEVYDAPRAVIAQDTQNIIKKLRSIGAIDE